jgi:hypothetical protein
VLMRAPAGMISLHSGHEKEDEASGRTVSTQRAHSSWLPSQGMILGSRSPSSKDSKQTGHSRALIRLLAAAARPRAASFRSFARARLAKPHTYPIWNRVVCMQFLSVFSTNPCVTNFTHGLVSRDQVRGIESNFETKPRDGARCEAYWQAPRGGRRGIAR